jgi:hypothetical protein
LPKEPPPAEFFRQNEAHKDRERALDAALASLAEIAPETVPHMDDEFDRMRNVVRALAAKRQSWSASFEFGKERRGKPPTEETIAQSRRLMRIHIASEKALAASLARLAEVSPKLVDQQNE